MGFDDSSSRDPENNRRRDVGLVLVRPSTAHKSSFLEGFHEFTTNIGWHSWAYLPEDAPVDSLENDFNGYVTGLLEREAVPPPGFVCSTVFWGLLADVVVGRIAIRHELNDFLGRFGGHIGYVVRPSHRRKGVASEMLRQVLSTDRARSIGRLLVTCDEGNVASERIILKNGGMFESMVDVNPKAPRKRRFWIDLSMGSNNLLNDE